MRDVAESKEAPGDSVGFVPTGFSTRGPRTVPRVDHERIFVLDAKTNLLGEYALNDDCPLESADLMRSMPVSGLRHLVSFYQGEYAFTPFKVDDLWFVILTHGVLRIEERGSVGTLLAAARIHIPPMIDPVLARREADLRAKEQELGDREMELSHREQRTGTMESEVRVASTQLSEREAVLRSHEASVSILHDYAAQLQRTFIPLKESRAKDSPAAAPAAPS